MRRISLVLGVVLTLFSTLSVPAFADQFQPDVDFVTVGTQNSISLSATPGQVQTFGADLIIECQGKSHMNSSVGLSYDSAASNVPSGGALSATSVTVNRPATWPADTVSCPSPNPATSPVRSTVTIGAPPTTGTFTYKVRWSANDADVNSGGQGQVSITLNVAPAAPVDTTPPVITSTVAGTAGSNGWLTSNATVSWSVTDPESAVVIDSGCGVQAFTAETAGALSGCTAHSTGGSATRSRNVKIDKTAPSAELSPAGTLGANGWYTSNVTVSTGGADSVSAPATCTSAQLQSAETTGAVFNGTCTNQAGLTTSAAPLTVKVDTSGPSATAQVTAGTLGANGWYTSEVAVTTAGADRISGAVTCTTVQHLTTDTAGTTVAGTCTNAAGLQTASAPFIVRIDQTDPSASLSVTSGTLGANGWYTSDVTVRTAGADTVSEPVDCTADQHQTQDTTGTVFDGSCTNDAGRQHDADSLTIARDASPPTAELQVISGTPGANGWYTSDVTVRTVGADPTSGATCSADREIAVDTVGIVVTGSCTNDAGLTTEATPLTIKVDSSAPTAILAVSAGTPGDNGWYTSAVTVATSGADPVSGPVACSADQQVSDDSAGATVVGMCTNAAGLTTDATPLVVKLETTAPTVGLAVTGGTLGANGWYTSDVTIATSGADSTSTPVTCTAPQDLLDETAGTFVAGSCTNDAGLSTDATSLLVKLDKSAPSTELVVTAGTLGANGWYTSDVTVATSGADSISGPLSCTADQVLATETTGIEVQGSCTNDAGLTTDATPITVKLDTTAPTAQLSVTAGTLGANGWYTSDVTVATSGADSISGPVTCTADQVLATETTGTDVTGSCTNDAGLMTDATPVTIKLDGSNPTAALSADGTLGANGWYTSAVVVHTTGADTISAPVACTPDQHQTDDTTGTEFNGSCANEAGSLQSADPLTVKVDTTPPTATLQVMAGTVGANGWYTSDVTVATVGEDATSGVTCTADSVVSTETAGTVVTGSCTNGAGLSTDAAPITIKLDQTGPSAALAVTDGTLGTNGWYTSDVTVATSGADSISGPITCTADQVLSTETTGSAFHGTCTNDAGLATDADALTIKLDKSGPAAAVAAASTLGSHGWYIADVTVSTTGSDDIGAPVACTPDQLLHDDTTGTVVTGSCTNDAGLATDAAPVTIKLDQTGPSASLAITAGDLGGNGWYTSPVTVATSGGDVTSAPVTCSADQTFTTDTLSTAVPGACTNAAGLSTDAAPLTFKLDTTDPSANLSVTSGDAGANGWYTSDVTVHTSGADNVSEPVDCTTDQQQVDDTPGTVFHGSCTNNAGRHQDAEPLTIGRDASPPTATLEIISGNVGANGWYTSDVTVRTVGTDPTSGASCSAQQTLTAETGGTIVTGSCTNDAGLSTAAAPLTIKLDKTAPTAQLAVVGGALGANDWYTSDVTVRASGSDTVSGAVTCTPDQSQTSETSGAIFHGSCTNAAGLTTAAEAITVKLDASGPSAAVAVSAGTLGANGWYTSHVTVRTSGADDLSGPVTCTADQHQTNDTAGAVFTGSCTNTAGLTTATAPLTVMVDKTAPVVAVTSVAPIYQLATLPTPGCATQDVTSGVAANATPTITGGNANGVGTFTVTCAGARDRAGNTGSTTLPFRVVYAFDGFLQPINDTAHQTGLTTSVFKAGSTVPVKLQLKRADGTVVSPTTAPQWLTPTKGGATSVAVDESSYSGPATTGGSYRWDANGRQLIYNWATPKSGLGYYWRIGATLDDGQTYFVNIGLK